MIRLKIIKPHKKHKVGDIIVVTNNEAHGLLDSGVAIQTKDMTQVDYRTKKWRRS